MYALGRCRKCLRSGHIVQHVEMVRGCYGRFHADADAQLLACGHNSMFNLFVVVADCHGFTVVPCICCNLRLMLY